MERFKSTSGLACGSHQGNSSLFAKSIRCGTSTSSFTQLGKTTINQEQFEWLMEISHVPPERLCHLQVADREVCAKPKFSALLPEVSTKRRFESFDPAWKVDTSRLRVSRESRNEHWSKRIVEWNEADHPRKPPGPGGGQWATKGGGGTTNSAPRSFSDVIVQRNNTIAGLTGDYSPELMRSSRMAIDLDYATNLPGEISSAVGRGLKTGAKANVNGLATAIRSTATLGLNTNQLEPIGVTKADRDAGYDTAVAITTASGGVLIAVGTGGIASALSKGGSVARAASGAMVAYDAAGNAVGVVQGTYDATQNGLNLSNGTQIAGGVLGLKANAKAAGNVKRAYATAAAERAAEIDRYVATLKRKPTPTSKASGRYEVKHTGPYNYTVLGGGTKLDIDGYRGPTILDAKHVDNVKKSPYVPESSCFPPVRDDILAETRDELIRARKIIESRSTPFKSVEIITNHESSKRFFEGLLKELGVPGTVQLKP